MKKNIIKAIIKVILLTPVCALGMGMSINFLASLFTENGLSKDASIGVLVVSLIVSFALLSSIYYGDYTNGYWGKSNNDYSKNASNGKNSNHVYVSSSTDFASEGNPSKHGYNGPMTLPVGCYEPFFDLDNDGKMSEYETYLQWENEQHIKNNTPSDFWN